MQQMLLELILIMHHTFSSGYAVLPHVAHLSCVPENIPAALLGDLVCNFTKKKKKATKNQP